MGMELENGNVGDYETDGADFSDSELTYYVRDALISVSSGDTVRYERLVGAIELDAKRRTTDEVALLVTSLKALSGAVSYIDRIHHQSLLSAIFSMDLWCHGVDVMDALMELIIALAASDAFYVDPCLEMLLINFMPPMSFLNILSQPRGIEKKHHVADKVHEALEGIADLVPLAPMLLSIKIAQRMPNVFSPQHKDLIAICVGNMLRLESGAIGDILRNAVFKAVVSMLVELDVQIELVDNLQEESSKGIFQMELEELDGTEDDAEEDYGELLRESSARKTLRKSTIADKLDCLMVVTFEHLNSCYNSHRLQEVFSALLTSFQETVLEAYKSKFAQFVIFYACSLDPENCGVRFSEMLADNFASCLHPPVRRMANAAYLASYLARAKFVPVSLVMSIIKRLVDWCLDYCQSHCGDGNAAAHGVFYSGCQAIMYVLCFRMRSMMDAPRLRSQLLLMPLESILKHQLDPLKVCLPSIVSEFLRQAKAARLFTVSESFVFNDMLESNKSKEFGGRERLDMFFPFDPCLLKACDSFIRPSFIYWSMVKKTYDEECTSDEDEVEEFLDEVGTSPPHEELGKSFEEYDIDVDEFDCALDKMSITPKNYKPQGGLHVMRQMPSRIRPSMSPESL